MPVDVETDYSNQYKSLNQDILEECREEEDDDDDMMDYYDNNQKQQQDRDKPSYMFFDFRRGKVSNVKYLLYCLLIVL